MDDRMGATLNGPSLLHMPDWAAGRLGRYHLYFSDHKGDYIRLAYADHLTGPWRTYRPGVLDLRHSLFETLDPPEPPAAARPAWAKEMEGGYLYAHIASPDLHLDHETRVIRMYYHGLMWNGDQQTRLALSCDGLSFTPQEPLLGPSGFRVFAHDGFLFAFASGARLYRARHWSGPFETGPQLLPFAAHEGRGEGCRLGAVCRQGNRLHLVYSRMGDCPERILHCELALEGDWQHWSVGPSRELLAPERPWEGGDLSALPTRMGAANAPACELRDPFVFRDGDGALYLLYCGGGERGIGIAALET